MERMQFVGVFFNVNNGKDVDARNFQVMRCLLCYTSYMCMLLIHAPKKK
jgi:hypothetical protein